MFFNFLINQSSFDLYYESEEAARDGMRQIIGIIIKVRNTLDRIGPNSGDCWQLVGHSELQAALLTQNYSLFTWILEQQGGIERGLFIRLLIDGPYIDEILRTDCPNHQCEYLNLDYKNTSLAGACYCHWRDQVGILISNVRDDEFKESLLKIYFGWDDKGGQEFTITNLTNQECPEELFWKIYHSSPRHEPGGTGTLMDLDGETSEKILNMGIQEANHIFGYLPKNSKFYKFMLENQNGNTFHGFPEEDLSRIPETIKRRLKKRAERGYLD